MTKNTQENAQDTVQETQDAVTETAVVSASDTSIVEVAKTKPSQIIAAVVANMKTQFAAANDGMDLDFVRFGDWLKINKKGQFIERDNEDVNYGEDIDVIIAHGEQRWTLWGIKESAEDGVLITAGRTQEESVEQLAAWLEANPGKEAEYTADMIRLCYLAQIVPVQSLVMEEGETLDDLLPSVYLFSFSPTDTYEVGHYAGKLFMGKYKTANIPKRTALNSVVTRITTEEKKSKNNEWIGVNLRPVTLFKPEDYGIQYDANEGK